jgi:hypothetical protein
MTYFSIEGYYLMMGDPESPSQAFSKLKVFSAQEISLVKLRGNFLPRSRSALLGSPASFKASLLNFLVHSSAEAT